MSARKMREAPTRVKAVAVAYPTPEGKAVPAMRTRLSDRMRERGEMYGYDVEWVLM